MNINEIAQSILDDMQEDFDWPEELDIEEPEPLTFHGVPIVWDEPFRP